MSNLMRQISMLLQSLSSDKAKIGFLLGAGCPASIRTTDDAPLIMNIKGMTESIKENPSAAGVDRIFSRLAPQFPSATIEDALTHIRLLKEVVGASTIDDFDKHGLDKLELEICNLIRKEVDKRLPTETTPYHHLASWIQSTSRNFPVEIFTPNYDTLIESVFEERKIPYFDGFIGSNKAFFDLHSIEYDCVPNRWVRVWKLHGSTNWWRDENNDVYRGSSTSPDSKSMIFPSHLKYDQSRKMPYLAMQDRLGHFLASGQPVLVVIGYSFVDQHINEIITQRLIANPGAICFGLLYDPLDAYQEAIKNSQKATNLSLLAKDGCVIGSKRYSWDRQSSSVNHLASIVSEEQKEIDGTITSIHSRVGDFAVLGKLLLEQVGTPEASGN